MTPFKLKVTQKPAATIVAMSGDIGMLELERLDGHLKRVASRKPRLVVFDLSKVGMLSSGPLGSLVMFQQDIQRGGSRVRLAAVHPFVLDLLQRASINRLFEIHPTVNAAIDELV